MFPRFSLLLALIVLTSCSPTNTVDLIVHNGTIQTMDEKMTIATAMAVKDGKIVAVGSSEKILAEFSAAEVIDLKGQFVFPGFIDAHAHLYGLGEEQEYLRLRGTANSDQAAEMVAQKAAALPEGTWVMGRGWDQNDWPTNTYPSKEQLDSATTRHPVFLSRIDGHAVWVNSAALHAAGITAQTPDPSGGRIIRDKKGTPTGILIDNAVDLVKAHIPHSSPETMRRTFRAAVQECLCVGLTTVQDMGLTARQIDIVNTMILEDDFSFRLLGYIPVEDSGWTTLKASGRTVSGNHQLVLAGVKIYADGALGSRGAYLLEPYADDPGNKGTLITSEDNIRLIAEEAFAKGLQVCVHAIGDGANRITLNALEAALRKFPSLALRPRIEHVQVLHPEDIPRFAALGVIPSMQPTHCTSDMYWAEVRLGPKRARGAYAWQSLLKTGVRIPAGSDFPVERPSPLAGIYAACSRRDAKGVPASEADIEKHFYLSPQSESLADRYADGWYGKERMTRVQALRAFTIWAAKAAGLDDVLGSLEPGKYADFVIVDGDLMKIPDRELLSRRIVTTCVAGITRFKQKL